MKKLNLSQMENLQGKGPHACNITSYILGGAGVFNAGVGLGAAIFGLGCYLYSMP